ncbi:peptidoglycan-binding protein [Streptomyces sp. NPDC005566]|uniref:peptidoglycan-binding domain-containing protein n=1 Tax=Streptomyces sp. NPDC005566 TaxID=3156886 RepID=UPI0033A1EC7F
MRQKVLARTLVSLTAAVGIAAGSLAGAGAGFAAPAQNTTATSAEAGVFATDNLGLSPSQAKAIQRVLKDRWGYTGDIDGELGTNSWKAMQRFLKAHWGYTDSIDGDPGPNTVRALQRYLKEYFGYTGKIDGDPGPGTQAAFKRAANACPAC